MEVVLEKCNILIMKSRKRERVKGTELSNQESIRMFGEKKSFKILGIVGSGHH